jgi:hypothetical protein
MEALATDDLLFEESVSTADDPLDLEAGLSAGELSEELSTAELPPPERATNPHGRSSCFRSPNGGE